MNTNDFVYAESLYMHEYTVRIQTLYVWDTKAFPVVYKTVSPSSREGEGGRREGKASLKHWSLSSIASAREKLHICDVMRTSTWPV